MERSIISMLILSIILCSNIMNNPMKKQINNNSIYKITKEDVAELKIQPGQIWRHYKNKDYRILGVSCHSEELTWYVVYEALYDNEISRVWHRPLDMFLETIHINNQIQPRFQRIK